MKKLIPTRLLSQSLKVMVAVFTLFATPMLALAEDAAAAADVVQPPKEFNPMQWDWVWIATLVLIVLLILIIARTFDIGSLAEKVTGKRVIGWNKVNAWVAILFLIGGSAGVAYEMVYHGKLILLNDSSSEHGQALDSMFNWTFAFTFVVFAITEFLLFYFMYRYHYREGKKALYFYHNNKLELIWTVVPAIVLTFLVLRGFNTWSRITNVSNLPKDAQTIEVFAYQFGWKARYAGKDNEFGQNSFTFISGTNPLGLAVNTEVDALITELHDAIDGNKEKHIVGLKTLLASVEDSTNVWTARLRDYEAKQNTTAYPVAYKEIREKALDAQSGAYRRNLERDIKRKETNLMRIAKYRSNKEFFNNAANDDKITGEIVLVKGKTYLFKFRARDVIHSAYMPEFRAQMNVVPGMSTKFAFTPTHTTKEIRKIKGDTAYDFHLYCNKICGSAHYNMKIKITVVESMDMFNLWLSGQAPVVVPIPEPAPAEKAPAADSTKNAKPTVASK